MLQSRRYAARSQLPYRRGTVEQLLAAVQLTFHDHVANVLAEPLKDANTLALHAAIHGRVIIDLLTAISIAKWKQEGVDLSHYGESDTKATAERWLGMIVDIARCEEDGDDDPPQLSSAVQYVKRASETFAAVARILAAEQRGLDPRPDEDALTYDDAVASLVCVPLPPCASWRHSSRSFASPKHHSQSIPRGRHSRGLAPGSPAAAGGPHRPAGCSVAAHGLPRLAAPCAPGSPASPIRMRRSDLLAWQDPQPAKLARPVRADRDKAPLAATQSRPPAARLILGQRRAVRFDHVRANRPRLARGARRFALQVSELCPHLADLPRA